MALEWNHRPAFALLAERPLEQCLSVDYSRMRLGTLKAREPLSRIGDDF